MPKNPAGNRSYPPRLWPAWRNPPARPGGAADGPVAQVFVLAHNDPTKLVEAIRPFLTTPGGYIQAETGQRVLIVGDYPSVLRRVETADPAT